MPRKHVHFSSRDEIRTIPALPATPSPTFSDISLPDSEGPITPPQATIALPGAAKAAPCLHGDLAFHPHVPVGLLWDISRLPSTAAIQGKSGSRLRTALAEPATNPPTRSMTLVSDLLPYAIPVHAGAASASSSPYGGSRLPLPTAHSGSAKYSYVSVHDVIAAVYAFLRTPISGREYAGLPPARQEAVAYAFQKRVDRVSDSRERAVEHSKGVKRIDLLLGTRRTRFAGLASTKGREVWVLNLG